MLISGATPLSLTTHLHSSHSLLIQNSEELLNPPGYTKEEGSPIAVPLRAGVWSPNPQKHISYPYGHTK
jgi:hypothetical protein